MQVQPAEIRPTLGFSKYNSVQYIMTRVRDVKDRKKVYQLYSKYIWLEAFCISETDISNLLYLIPLHHPASRISIAIAYP